MQQENIVMIDAHQHFWHYDPKAYPWIGDAAAVLKQDYLPEQLKQELSAAGIEGCISVQARQLEEENDFLIAQANEHDFIKGIVGWVDLNHPQVEERLEYYRQFKIVKGFRHVLHDEPDAYFMLQPTFTRGIAALEKYQYCYDILIFQQHLPQTIELVQQFPRQKFVVDHIAKPSIRNGEIHDWEKNIRELAHFENVCCKVSGMITEADVNKWKQEDFDPYLQVVTEAFGASRIMYGSDWPVCRLGATYAGQLELVKNFYSHFSEDEKARVFGGNAARFYNL